MNKQPDWLSRQRLCLALSTAILTLGCNRLFAQSLDAFDPGANDAVYAIALQPDARILLGGHFSTLGATARNRLGCLTPEGSLDPTFNLTPNNDIYALAVQPDGRWLAAGTFSMLTSPLTGTAFRAGVARFNADGSLDTTFDAGSAFSIYSLALLADGKILVGGSFTTLGGQARRCLGRLNTDGTIDTNFTASASGTVTTLTLQPDGKILVSGSFTQLNGVARNFLGRLNPDGTLDTLFNPGANGVVNTLLVQPDGKILVGGAFTLLGGQAIKYLGRLDAAGTIETAFDPKLDGAVNSLALQADGHILMGGSFTSSAGQPCSRLARLNADGSLDTTFNPTPNGTVNSLALQIDGQLLVGGGFTILAGQTRNHIGRFNNPAPATQSLFFENATLTWWRSATSPQFGRVSFELTTNGTDWAQLAPVTHATGGWQVTNLSLPASYAIRARGFLTSGQNNSSSWSVLAALGEGRAVIVDPPLSQRINSGAAVALRVLAAGTPPLAYQWRKNGQDIPGATDPAYLLSSSAPADAGNYSVCVSNAFGAAFSRPVVLTVLRTNMPFAATQPPGPVGATNATLNGMATPRGYPTTAWFEWGTDLNYGQATLPVDVGNGSRVVRLGAPIDGLTAGGVYHYRLVASNAFGVTLGPDRLFTTGMRVATWGDYTQGYPVTPSGLSNLVAVASGHSHLLALRNDGTVAAWHSGGGYLFPGQIDVPAGLSNVIAIAGGYGHTLALQQDGTVSSWGRYMISSLPVTVPAGLSNVIAIAGGDSHSLALKSDGTVVAWGDNSSKQTSVPSSLSNVVAIAAGSTHSLALKADGQVVAWGNDFGTVTPPTSLSNVVAISAESWHHLALRADGTLVAWGYNDSGQLNVPAGLQEVAAIATGFRHSLALKADGTLVAWGDPYYVTNLPPGLSQGVAISSGDYHSLALTPMNLAPRPFNTSATGYPDRDLVLALKAWDPNGDGLTYRIASPPTNGTLYQYTANGRGELLNSPATPVTDPLGRVIFSPLPDTFGVPLTTLSLLANDGTSDSPPGLLAVNIVPPPAIQASGWVQNTNRGLAVSFAGLSNASYTVQASSDLTNWSWVGSASQTAPGQFYFLDSGATNRPQRFYRLRSP